MKHYNIFGWGGYYSLYTRKGGQAIGNLPSVDFRKEVRGIV